MEKKGENFLESVWLGEGERKMMVGSMYFLFRPTKKFSLQNEEKIELGGGGVSQIYDKNAHLHLHMSLVQYVASFFFLGGWGLDVGFFLFTQTYFFHLSTFPLLTKQKWEKLKSFLSFHFSNLPLFFILSLFHHSNQTNPKVSHSKNIGVYEPIRLRFGIVDAHFLAKGPNGRRSPTIWKR